MSSDKTVARIAGVLFLIIFISGIIIYQVLQGPVLFAEDFITRTSFLSSQIILSTLLGLLSGTLGIIISIIILPIINRKSQRLGYLYLAFLIVNFVAIAIDNINVLALLELSREYVKRETTDLETLRSLGTILFKKHWWSHYMSLITSCLPVFTLYYTMYFTRLIPRAISLFGILAVLLMFVEIVASIFGQSISMNMMLPMGIAQLIFPIWLLIKGFSSKQIVAS